MTMHLYFAMATVVFAALLAFALSAIQSYINASTGTDHAVHSFLIRAIRKNQNRFFVRIPNLLNEAYIGAFPLYLHFIFARLPRRILPSAEKLLNPIVNGIHVLIVGYIAVRVVSQTDLDNFYIAFTALLFAFTPQFYHALSARNFGLSARSIGLVLLTIFYMAAYNTENESGIPYWVLLIMSGYLIWAFSTFGMQVLVIVSTLLALLTDHLTPIIGTVGGLIVFVAVHPRYSLGYLRHTVRFIRSYAKELAPIYVLGRRHSIWRDLVYDFWSKIWAQPLQGLRYAYENSVIIVIILNPLLLVSIYANYIGWPEQDSLLAFSADLAICGTIAMIITSFRVTRFLGEPERYIEAITPWVAIIGTSFLVAVWGKLASLLIVFLFLGTVILQLFASHLLSRHLNKQSLELGDAENAIAAAGVEPIRCCSNNEHITKLLMHNDWNFSYCIAVGNGYCGMTISEAFSAFPKLNREACEKIVKAYRVNICVLDRKLYDNIFDVTPQDLISSDIIFESQDLRVLSLEWKNPKAGEQPRVDGLRAGLTWS